MPCVRQYILERIRFDKRKKDCRRQMERKKFHLLFWCAPGGARFQRVQVPNPPGSGKDIAEGKGVHREVESEGSWM